MRVKWKNVLRFYEYIQPYLKVSKPIEEKPVGKMVLVLSPHIDDDILGAGGTLYKHHLAGDKIVSIYIASLNDKDIRQKEGERATEIIGIDELIFLDYEIKKLDHSTREISRQIADLLNKYQPDIVYLPFMLDNHNDHISTNKIFLDALSLRPAPSLLIYAYEIWSTLFPNVLVDITDQIEVKKQAILEYKSQLLNNNYLDAIVGLNRYRGILSKANGYAEGFFRSTPEGYRNLWRSIYES
ncbi:MAG: PIG-L deacetylase family protein [Candidatus Desantisbacteria bacterium]